MRSALFVDFDNVLLGLQPTSKVGAQRFATSPETWLPWFEAAGHVDDEARDERRILLRRVYMNPDRFGTYRKYFTYCGFETIDCPSLTGMGKNSADIRMVLDIVDALDHPTRFDEFIILSADADFTPVLQKLRAHDRETAVLSTPLTARPLKSAATYAFEVDDFLENALGVSTDTKFDETSVAKVLPVPLAPPPPNSVPLRRAAEILEAHVRKQGWTPTSEVARILLAEQPEFADSQWLGQGKLNAMLSAALQARPGSYARKLRDGVHGIGVAPADEVVAPGAIPPDSADLPAAILEAPNAGQVLDFIEQELARSDKPLLGSALGTKLTKEHGQILRTTNWFGAGSLARLIHRAQRPGLMSAGFFVWDPRRHTAPDPAQRETDATGLSTELARFLRQLDAVGWPPLTPDQITCVISEAVRLIQEGVTEQNPLSAQIRDRLHTAVDQGRLPEDDRLPRRHIGALLASAWRQGAVFGETCVTEADFRKILRAALEDRVRNALGGPMEVYAPLIAQLLRVPPDHQGAGTEEGLPTEPASLRVLGDAGKNLSSLLVDEH